MDPSNSSVCIMCKQEKAGTPVKNDFIIEIIRKLKKKIGAARNNRLVVCQECMEQYETKRKNYERLLTQNIVIGIGIVVLLIGLPLVLARVFMLEQVLPALGLGFIIAASSVLWHVPAIAQKSGQGEAKPAGTAQQEEKVKQ